MSLSLSDIPRHTPVTASTFIHHRHTKAAARRRGQCKHQQLQHLPNLSLLVNDPKTWLDDMGIKLEKVASYLRRESFVDLTAATLKPAQPAAGPWRHVTSDLHLMSNYIHTFSTHNRRLARNRIAYFVIDSQVRFFKVFALVNIKDSRT